MELLLVFVVLAVALLPLITIQFRARDEITTSLLKSQANQLASSQMERLRAGGFANAHPDSGLSGPFLWNIGVQPDAHDPLLHELQVQVRWTENGERCSLRIAAKQAAR